MTYDELQDRFPDVEFPPEGTPEATRVLAMAQTNPRAAADYARGVPRRSEINTLATK